MSLTLPDPQLPGNPQDALQSIQRNFEALAGGIVGTGGIENGAVTADKLGLTVVSDTPSGNTTTFPANLAGLSLSLDAGTYLAVANINSIVSGGTVGFRIYNDTDATGIGPSAYVSNSAVRAGLSVVQLFTLSATKTITIRQFEAVATAAATTFNSDTQLAAVRLS